MRRDYIATEQAFYREAFAENSTRRQRGYGWEHSPSESMRGLLVDNGLAAPQRRLALDLGIGDGRNATYLQECGYTITGVDFVFEALAEARERLGPGPTLVHQDLTQEGALDQLRPVHLVLDWSVMDHIRPRDLPTYKENVLGVMQEGAYLLSTQFHPSLPGIDEDSRDKTDNGHYSRTYSIEQLVEELAPLQMVDHRKGVTEDLVNGIRLNSALFRKGDAV